MMKRIPSEAVTELLCGSYAVSRDRNAFRRIVKAASGWSCILASVDGGRSFYPFVFDGGDRRSSEADDLTVNEGFCFIVPDKLKLKVNVIPSSDRIFEGGMAERLKAGHSKCPGD